MHQFEYEYDPSEQPRFEEIGTVKIHDPSGKEQIQDYFPSDEVIIKIRCKEGWFYVVRKNYHTPVSSPLHIHNR